MARAKPDGYTLLVGSMSTHTMNQALYGNMPFDGVKDFTPIAELALVTNTMVVHPSVPASNVKEFIDYVKANPDKVAYASAGQGSTNHLSAALFEKAAGVKMMHIPYLSLIHIWCRWWARPRTAPSAPPSTTSMKSASPTSSSA